MSDIFDLTGRTALVIGGSSGIGRALALGLREAGATALAVGRDRGKLDRVAVELGGDGAPLAYEADVRDAAATRDLAARVEGDHGRVHVLVNCQGTTAIKPALETTEEEYDAILGTNLRSVFFACLTFGTRMIAAGGGSIVNISSLSAHGGWAGAAAYGASKAGVANLTQSLAAEWGPAGVRVNAIAPGFFPTDLNRERMSEARKAEARRRAAMGRMGEPRELVGAAVYLASDAAGFVTGTTIRVDGGYLASGI